MLLYAELLSGGNLIDRLATSKSYTEADAARLMHQLLSAVNHCHAKGLVHMDLKPENIVLADT
jgi:serine/threonine protein kinase